MKGLWVGVAGRKGRGQGHSPCSWILNAELGNCAASHLDDYREDQPEPDLGESWGQLAWDGCQLGLQLPVSESAVSCGSLGGSRQLGCCLLCELLGVCFLEAAAVTAARQFL